MSHTTYVTANGNVRLEYVKHNTETNNHIRLVYTTHNLAANSHAR